MSKKIYSIISIIVGIMLMFLLQNEVYAASATMSASSTKIEPGKTVNVTANIKSSASWALDISTTGGTLKKNDSRVGNTDSGNNEDKTITLGTFTTETAGTYKITLSGYVVDGETFSKTNVNATISIVVEQPVVSKPEPEPEKPSTTPEPEKPATVKKSSEARLKNFGINPSQYDFSGFSKNTSKENWSTTVPNDVSEVEVYATPKDSKAKVEGTGKVTLKEGDNTVKVKVTSEDGTTKTYTLTINRKTVDEQAKENGEARLKNLGIKPEEYDFTGFNSEKTEYTVEVPNEIEEVEVYATAINSNAQITGTGMIEIAEGVNELLIDVIAIDGTKKTYTIRVTRKESEETTGTTTDAFGLSILTVKGLTLTPKFNTEIYEYAIDLNEDISSLEIGTRPTVDDATVEIVGNDNLQQGENVITILVTDEETKEVVTYQITVNKSVVVQDVEEQVQTSWLKPETWGKEERIKIAIIIILIVLIICAIILKIKISKGNDSEDGVQFPGAKELDKAITEHQELSGEPNNETLVANNVGINYTETFNEKQDKQNYIEEIANNKFDMEENIEVKGKRRGRHF